MRRTNLIGMQFGRLFIEEYSHNNKQGKAYWKAKCSCGETRIILTSDLKSGHTKSCGCLRKEILLKCSFKHGLNRTPTYRSWSGMKARCLNPKEPAYKYYGGRGIKVCDRWLNSFENFYTDMGKKPEGLTIERLDNNGDYSPGNCKWATRTEQMNNTRHNTILKYNGLCLTVAEW
ncbi:MAG TPA: hypothetical protein ENH82_07765, partial [bacterium]|nr:hypothetical protein [bacterium]